MIFALIIQVYHVSPIIFISHFCIEKKRLRGGNGNISYQANEFLRGIYVNRYFITSPMCLGWNLIWKCFLPKTVMLVSQYKQTVSPEMEMTTQLKNRKKNLRKSHSSSTVLDWAISAISSFMKINISRLANDTQMTGRKGINGPTLRRKMTKTRA